MRHKVDVSLTKFAFMELITELSMKKRVLIDEYGKQAQKKGKIIFLFQDISNEGKLSQHDTLLSSRRKSQKCMIEIFLAKKQTPSEKQ